MSFKFNHLKIQHSKQCPNRKAKRRLDSSLHTAEQDPLYDQKEAEEYIFMNLVKRERLDRGWTQKDLADRLEVKQSTVAKWERKNAVYRKKTRQKLAKVFRVNEEVFL